MLSLLLLLQSTIDQVLKCKAELDGVQAEAAGFGCDGVKFAVRMRNLGRYGAPMRQILQEEVDKLQEIRDLIQPANPSLMGFINQKVHLLQQQQSEEDRLQACQAEFAYRERNFDSVIRRIAEGYHVVFGPRSLRCCCRN